MIKAFPLEPTDEKALFVTPVTRRAGMGPRPAHRACETDAKGRKSR
jgi:hypothetical protein